MGEPGKDVVVDLGDPGVTIKRPDNPGVGEITVETPFDLTDEEAIVVAAFAS